MKPMFQLSSVILAGLMLVACASQKAPAEAAFKAAQDAFSAVSAEATTYVPDQAKSIQDSLAAAQEAITKGDYMNALKDAQALPAMINDLKTAAMAKKDELVKGWTEMSGGLPGMVEAIKGRVDTLTQSKKLPAGMTQEALDGAKSGLDAITQTWTDATSAFQSGNVMDAVAKANEVKAKATEIMSTLGIEAPAPAAAAPAAQ